MSKINLVCMWLYTFTKLLLNMCDIINMCGLMVRVPGYRCRGPGSIPSATRFSEK
jgi:hypothetical protein